MVRINQNFLKLPGGYLFPEIARRVRAFENPSKPLIRLGIGDVTQPLAPVVIEAMHRAVEEMGHKETFRGYCEETCGAYDFLRFAIRDDYKRRGVDIADDEIFVSDGAKSDCGNIGDILSADVTIGVTDPVYPVYVDSNVMSGRGGERTVDGRWTGITFLPVTAENGFVPQIPAEKIDIIYLCYPNNPTGTVITRDELKKWVDYALQHRSIIFYDAAYEAYIRHDNVPHTIYEIPGAKRCAIEFHSFSKTAGFTGVRCGYTVVPKSVAAYAADGSAVPLHGLWNRRQTTKFNGVSYPVQRAAEASLSPEGIAQTKADIAAYKRNLVTLAAALKQIGIAFCGGENAPYVFIRCPNGMSGWSFFDMLLEKEQIAGTPGEGFGAAGAGCFRFTAFGTAEDTEEAARRIIRGL